MGNQDCRQVTQKVRQWNAKVEGETLIQFNILFKADRKTDSYIRQRQRYRDGREEKNRESETRAEQREKGIGCFVCVSVLHVS